MSVSLSLWVVCCVLWWWRREGGGEGGREGGRRKACKPSAHIEVSAEMSLSTKNNKEVNLGYRHVCPSSFLYTHVDPEAACVPKTWELGSPAYGLRKQPAYKVDVTDWQTAETVA